MLRQWLFETPWWLPTALLGVGIVLLASGNRRQDKGLLRAGIALALLGIVIGLVSYFVETDKENVVERTRQLVAAVNDRDWTTFQSLLDSKTSFSIYHNREELAAGAQKTADRIGLKTIYLTSVQAKQIDTLITVDLDAISSQDATMGRPMTTSWRLQWQDHGNGWFLYKVEPLPNQTVKPEDITRELVR